MQSNAANRRALVEALLNLSAPLSETLYGLSAYPWDHDDEPVLLTNRHIHDVLARYLANDLSETDVENWADAIECREDIEYEEQSELLIDRVVHQLANPTLYQPITSDLAINYQHELVAVPTKDYRLNPRSR